MRVYRADGTYKDNPDDTGFGWYLSDLQPENLTREPSNEEIQNDVEYSLPAIPYQILPQIEEETPRSTTFNEEPVEGYTDNFNSLVDDIAPKEKLLALINPVNPEAKALMGVVNYSRYTKLNDKETGEEVLKNVNLKTTNSRHLISERLRGVPNFLLSVDCNSDLEKKLACEIRDYHENKEENKLSLMMELINTDLDSNLSDGSYLNASLEELNNIGALDTSDLGNSIQSSLISKEGVSSYLDVPNRLDILSSIGLSEDIDKSIQHFYKEKIELLQQMNSIRDSFEEDSKKIENLKREAISLQNDLRETVCLSNLIRLLNGNLDKVKDNKLPFRIFHRTSIEDENLIV